MSKILFDTNVLLDIATADSTWLPWSEGQFKTAIIWTPDQLLGDDNDS